MHTLQLWTNELTELALPKAKFELVARDVVRNGENDTSSHNMFP